MQGNHHTMTIHVPGTLAANVTPVFTVPYDCQLEHVSANGSNANDATVKIGSTASDAAYMAAKSVGDSDVPAEFGRADFVDGEYPHIPDGTKVKITVDFDGAGGAAIANLTVVLTFSEG